MPDSVSVPAPALLMAVVALAPPLPLAILPAKVVLEPLAPTVKVAPQFTDELAANVKRLAPTQPILMITGSIEKFGLPDSSVDALLQKPFTIPAAWSGGKVGLWLKLWWTQTFFDQARIWLDGALIRDLIVRSVV